MFGTFRFVLACLVALSHFGLAHRGLNPGGWAVIAFYVLSGFLMERQYRKLCPRGGSRAFYFDRLLRIFPLYVTVLVLAGILVPRSFSTVVANLLLFPTNYFEFTGGTAMVGVAWSLACEAHFYLLVPFLARASTKALRWMAAGSVAVFIVSPFLPHSTFWAYTGFPGMLFTFLSGMLIQRRDVWFLRRGWLFFLVLLGAFGWSKVSQSGLPTGIHVNVCVGFLLALPAVFLLSGLTPKVIWDRRLGLLSYPLFLVHESVLILTLQWFHHSNALYLLAVSVAAAVILVFAVEKPFDKIRYSMRGRSG